MLNRIKELIQNKRVLILGYGKEGQSTYRILQQIRAYSQLDIADKAINDHDISSEHIFLSGSNYMDSLDTYDVVFKSPGIVLPKNPTDYSCSFTSQTDIFLNEYDSQTIGITGTKGKSTVATLLYHVLNTNGFDCLLAGNIGIPVFDIFDKIMPKTVVVLELSCHQLEYCNHSPATAMLLNIFEDHLDHYGSFENYARAKANIYKYQSANDTLFCHSDYLPSKAECFSNIMPLNSSNMPFGNLELMAGVKLRGVHNLLNCAFVYEVCKTFGVSKRDFIISLQSYNPLPHRMEFIGEKSGVDYYDDSISTTVESAISAVKSIPNAKVILLGGMDRGIDYSELVKFISQSNLSHVILMYESGKKIYDLMQKLPVVIPEIIYADDLYNATKLAQKYAKSGTSCILSPASASYGDFKNFEERGNVFKKLIFS